jgi:hypothetical protein
MRPQGTRSAHPHLDTPRPAYAWYVLAVLTLAYMSSFIDRMILNLLVDPIRRDMQISDTQMSLLMGSASRSSTRCSGCRWAGGRTRATAAASSLPASWCGAR